MKKSRARALRKAPKPELIKLDLGCGPNKKEGFVGVDALSFDGKVDVVHDLRKTPWPFKDGSVEEVYCSHFLEHLTGPERADFMNELYRVMRVGAQALIITPAWSSERAYGDWTHQWPPVVGFAWYYLDPAWRAANAPHSRLTCDFLATWGYSIAPPWHLKNQETQQFAIQHYKEVVLDMISTLTKRSTLLN